MLPAQLILRRPLEYEGRRVRQSRERDRHNASATAQIPTPVAISRRAAHHIFRARPWTRLSDTRVALPTDKLRRTNFVGWYALLGYGVIRNWGLDVWELGASVASAPAFPW